METNIKTTLIANALAALATHAWLKARDPVRLRVALSALLLVPSIVTYTIHIIAPSVNTINPRSTLTWAYLIYYTVLAVSVCAYRLSPFHPLAKYPGPLITRLTKLRYAWGAYTGKSYIYIKELHDRYGPIVRVGPNELSITEKELLPQILGSHGMPKGPQWDGRGFTDGNRTFDTLIASRNTAQHAQMRLPWNKAFTSEAVKSYEELLVPRVIEFNNHLKNLCAPGTAHLDIAKWLSRFAYDFMGDWVFSTDFRLMKDGDNGRRIEMMDKAMYFVSITQQVPWLYSFARRLPYLNRWVVRFVKRGIEDSIVRSQKELKRKDLFYYLADASGGSTGDFTIIVESCILATVAAADTTASVLCNAMYSLISNPEKYKKLQQEIDNFFIENDIDAAIQHSAAEGAEIKLFGEALGGLRYLNAVINETMRLFPVVPTGLHRAPEPGTGSKVLQSGDTFVYLPEGNSINVPLYVLHRDPRYFYPLPESFVPERWLPSASDEGYVTVREAFIPFSMGSANCAGRPVALTEMRYSLAFLIRNFNLEFDPKYDPALWVQGLRDQYTLQKADLHFKISLRNKA